MENWQKKLLHALRRYPLAGKPGGMAVVDREAAALVVLQAELSHDGPLLAITDSLARAEALAEELRSFVALLGRTGEVQVLPELERSRGSQLVPEAESERARLFDLADRGGGVYVASAMAAFSPAPAPARFRQRYLNLRRGETAWPPERLAAHLVALDYDSEAEVHLPGEFCRRGGILDFFSPVHDYPVRLDYLGDEIESMRFFEPESQRSVGDADECRIIPRGEAVLANAEEPDHCFLDYFPPDAVQTLVCDLKGVEAHLEQYGCERTRGLWEKFRRGSVPRVLVEQEDLEFGLDPDEVYRCPYHALAAEFHRMVPEAAPSWEVLQHQLLRSQMTRWAKAGYQLIVSCASESKLDRFREQLAADESMRELAVSYAQLPLPTGVMFPRLKLVLLSELEVYGKARQAPARRRVGHFHADYLERGGMELAEGDFAVHAGYGICRYIGIREEPFQDRIQEVMVLEFRDAVKLFVPLDQAYLVSRYVGAGKAYPRLSKIGAARWKNVRAEAEFAVNDLAADLLRLQAMRQAAEGLAFALDDSEMAIFEAAFPYAETEDQLRAVEQVADDMSAAKPMDRLVCGDVGFGKTEVAMRAAFRAVMAGKQVAVLVPTTVLCQQHLLTFSERFREYPVIIDMLSRFRTHAEQGQVLKALGQGTVDIVIGTHRLLSGDIRFRDLGLVVVDEEQRFGVAHKERLKQLRANVDVLTMTATPIPRTLYLAMAGLRDMSTIMSPPLARLPVQTVIAQYDEELIREAIRREVQRGGQVFFLHNRVRTIEKVRNKLARLAPEATFEVAHGQMHEHQLEEAMLRFLTGKVSVLVCTTIIESGLDIPNVNTIIIDRADRFGLADLYQLRGRVGRYHRQAYAYLLIPRHAALLDNARERLGAIRKYTHLGAGFRLAMRDLEIRGSGNILGREQSGHISAIGFSLYCELLREAVARLKHQELPRRPQLSVQLDFLILGASEAPGKVCASLPKSYVAEETVRVQLYRRLGSLTDLESLDEFAAELRDRFGPQPEEAERLLALSRLKLVAAKGGIHAISVREGKVLLETDEGLLKMPDRRLPRLQASAPAKFLSELIGITARLTGVKPVSVARRK